MKKTARLLLVAVVLMVAAAAEAQNATEYWGDFDQTWPIPCANDGEGEDVRLTGRWHWVSREYYDEMGNRHFLGHNKWVGVSGEGTATGDTYRATGGNAMTEYYAIPDLCPYKSSYENSVKIVGPGKGNDVTVHGIETLVFDANCELRVEFQLSSMTCK